MARAKTREVSGPSAIQAVARPVNTYVRPANPAPSPLHQLAEGLAAFDAGLGAFMDKRKGEQEEADKQRAIHDAHMGNAAGYDEGVKRGIIPAQESKVYMQTLKKTKAEIRGRQLMDEWNVAYQNWGERDTADPEAFKAFLGDFLKERVAEVNDPDMLAGLNPWVDQIYDTAYSSYTTDRSKALKADYLGTVGAGVMDEIDRVQEAGEVDQDALWDSITEQRYEALKRHTEAETDPMFVDTILLQAEESMDEDLLDLLDRKWPGKEAAISSDPDIRKKINATRDRITAGLASQATEKRLAEERAEKKRETELKDKVIRSMAEDPTFVPDEADLREIGRTDPEFRTRLGNLRKEIQESGTFPEDEQAIGRIILEVDQGAGKEFVHRMWRTKVIRSTDTYKTLLDRADKIASASEERGIFKDQTYKRMTKAIETAAGPGEFDMFGNSQQTLDTIEAMNDFNAMVLEWVEQNPEAGPVERSKAITEIGRIVLEGVMQEGQASVGMGPDAETDKYTPVDQRGQQQQPGEEQIEEPGQPGQPGAVPEYRSESHRSAVQTFASRNGVSEEEAYQRLEEVYGAPAEDAAVVPEEDPLGGTEEAPPIDDLAEGIMPPAEEVMENLWGGPTNEDGTPFRPITQFWNWLRGKVSGGSDEPSPSDDIGIGLGVPEADPITTQGLPGGGRAGVITGPLNMVRGLMSDDQDAMTETRDRLTSLLQNPPRVPDNIPREGILSLIGQTEGTDRGDGYNETLGYGAYTGGDVNLVGMTLDQIDALQTKMLRHPDNSWNSSAIGRYQIVRKTLRNLRKEMGLSGSELFDEDMQDRLALQLLEGRGLSKWRAGEIDDSTFLTNLAQEWASLPTSKGKGFYKGQKAATTPAKVLAALYDGPPGHSSAVLKRQPELPNVPKAYAKIPDVDGGGNAGQVAKFIEWNSDPVANHEANLKSIEPDLADVVRQAQKIAGVQFVVGSGRRDAALQQKAVEWGWSQTEDSDHLDGSAVDLWPIDKDGAVNFDSKSQAEIVKAMKAAAKELGVTLDVGAEWKGFKDKPHFAIKRNIARTS
jgi:muramidase (phage lysozyme)